jgi:hypothetical protein
MQKNNAPCLPELLNFCRKELVVVKDQMEQSLKHLIAEETLAALGAWDGLERRIAFVGCALQILAQLYPSRITVKLRTSKTQTRKGG